MADNVSGTVRSFGKILLMRLVLRALVAVASLFAVVHAAGARQLSDEWQLAAKRIVRLPPNAFRDLPARVRMQITADGCLVPQLGGISSPSPHNVVSGQFVVRGQLDWAIL